jgi:hypothetical protein
MSKVPILTYSSWEPLLLKQVWQGFIRFLLLISQSSVGSTELKNKVYIVNWSILGTIPMVKVYNVNGCEEWPLGMQWTKKGSGGDQIEWGPLWTTDEM